MAGQRARGSQDLRVSRGDQGIRPGILQMLFKGGSTERGLATDDLRLGRRESVRPRTSQPLFSGGPAGDRDLRTGYDDEEPDDSEALTDGGMAGDHESEEKLLAAEDILAAFKSGRASDLSTALASFFYLCDSEPHEEYPHEE